MWAWRTLGQACVMSTPSLLHAVYGFTRCASVKAPHTSAYTLCALIRTSFVWCFTPFMTLHPCPFKRPRYQTTA